MTNATHNVSFEHNAGDTIDTPAHAAFCDTCEWRGEWHHDDDETDGALLASFDADDHIRGLV